MAFDPRGFRKVMGHFAAGVTVITAMDPRTGAPVGMTVNSFNSVSVDPPLILFSLDRRALSLPAFQAAEHFAVNMLGADQRDLSARFARSRTDKWAETAYREGPNRSPLLVGSIAVLECRRYAVHDGGDHVIFLGEVLDVEIGDGMRPLVYYRGRYCEVMDLAVEIGEGDPRLGWS